MIAFCKVYFAFSPSERYPIILLWYYTHRIRISSHTDAAGSCDPGILANAGTLKTAISSPFRRLIICQLLTVVRKSL
jgi:hypothetical protein